MRSVRSSEALKHNHSHSFRLHKSGPSDITYSWNCELQ